MQPSPDDDNVPPELHQTTWCTNEAIKFIQEPRDTTTPWLLSVNPYDPHPPYDPPWEYWRRFQPDQLPGPHFRMSDLAHQAGLAAADFQSEARDPAAFNGQGIQAAYCAMIELVDEQFGRLLDALDASGQRDNTLVLFTSDHGDAAGDHGLIWKGCRFFDGLTRVPLIWSWPGRIEPNRRSPALVELTDIAPTLLEAAGEPVPDAMQGRSLWPLLNGGAALDRHRDFVRCEFFDALSLTPGTLATMYRDDRWKLVQYHSLGLGELYDLDSDPYEFTSLWDDPDHAEIRADLMERSFNATVMAGDPGPPSLRRR